MAAEFTTVDQNLASSPDELRERLELSGGHPRGGGGGRSAYRLRDAALRGDTSTGGRARWPPTA